MQTDVVNARHGAFRFYKGDEFVGASLARYGEYSEQEVLVFQKVLRAGQVAIEVGANIGALTVPMAKIIGPTGKLIVYEPSLDNAELLRLNLAHNDCAFVEVKEMAAGCHYGSTRIPRLAELPHKNYGRVEIGSGGQWVRREPIDNLKLDTLHFLKIDAEGCELEIIQGAAETIKRCRPILYVENDREDKSAALIGAIIDMGYRLFWHRPPLFNPQNFRGEKKNIFAAIASLMMVCVPEEKGIEVVQLDEVADIRDDDEMFDREITRYARGVARNPDDLTGRLMMAHYQNLMQREGEATALIAENLRRDPEHKPTHAIKGLMALQRGNWKEGWPAYELRYGQRNKHLFGGQRVHPVPKWEGEMTEAPVLIWNEQGFGDGIMFARFFKHVRLRAPNAILEVAPELFELFHESFLSPAGLYRMGRSLPAYKLHCSLPSTPAALGADEAMMRMVGPYLFADDTLTANWRNRQLGYTKIGICDRGSPRSERPFTRDVPRELLEPIGRRFGPFLNLAQDGQFESFADTAAAIASLDLVITVDTSIAHLAGAMDVPVWLLLSFDPDWRWGLKGSETIWYPSMSIFRQPAFRDWASVIADVSKALEGFTEHGASAAAAE
jgi:FkbM family methyltransferase